MESTTDQRKKFWFAVSSGVYFENNGYMRVHKRYDNVEIEFKNNNKFNKTVKRRIQKVENYSRYRIFLRNYVYQYFKVISPNNRYKLYWDCINVIGLCFSCLFIPFFVGFRLKFSSEIYSIFIVLDLINFIDLCLNFRTAYYNKSLDNYEYDPYKIILQYLKFWFWWDLQASIPTDLIINTILYNDSFHLEESPNALMLLRLFYFLKLSRMHKFFELKNIFEEFQLNPILIDVQILAVRMAFISHLLACFWNFIATFDTDSDTSYKITPDPPLLPVAHNTWVYVFNFSTGTLFDRYVASLYWALTTMLTVGYGDIHAVNWGEQLFSIVAELLGVVIFGAIVARIVEILKNVNPQRQAVKAEISELMAYLGENHNIPANVKADAKSACVYFMNNKTTFSESEILEELQLPTDILTDFIARGYTYQIHHFALFHDEDVNFVADIVTRLKPFKTQRKQTLLHYDDVIDELVFVMTGSVQMIINTKLTDTTSTSSSVKHPVLLPVILGQISPGGYLGDMEYEMVCLSLVTYRTVGKSSMYSLSYVDLTRALGESPQKCEDFYSVSNVRYQQLQISLCSSVTMADDGTAYKQLLWIDGEIKPNDDILKPGSRLLALSVHDDDIAYTTIKYDKENNRIVKAEETAAEINARWIIDPQNVNKLLWDVFTALLVLYSLLTMSITQTFGVESPSGYSKFDNAVNAIFFLDIAIVSRTAYSNSDGDLMTIPSKIFRRYFKGWFWLDLISSLPFDVITSNSSLNLSALKLFKMLRLIRFFKLTRVAEVMTWIEDQWPMGHGVIEITKLMFSIILVSHMVACLWWVLADSSSSHTWFDVNSLRDASITEQYIASLYWTVTTLTTVGYGDIIPSNSAERIIACFVMLLGGIAFGYIVGNMSSLLSNFDPTVAKVNDQTSRVRSFLEQKAFSNKFIGIVLKHLKNRLRHSSVFDEEAILSKLPTRVTREILSYRHAETINSLRIFKYIPNRSVVLYLRNKIQPLFYQADQLLFTEGDIPSGIIMITSGKTQRYSKISPKNQSVHIMHTSVAFLQRISKKKSFSKSSKQLLVSDSGSYADVDDNNSSNKSGMKRRRMSPAQSSPTSPSPSSTTTNNDPSYNQKSKWQKKLLKLAESTNDDDNQRQIKILSYQEAGDFLGIEELMENRYFRSSTKAMITTSAFILTQSNINIMITDAPAIALILQQALINLIIDYKLTKAKKKHMMLTEKFIDDMKIQFKLSKVVSLSSTDVMKRGNRRDSWASLSQPQNKNSNTNESSLRKLSALLGKQMSPMTIPTVSSDSTNNSTPKSIRYIFGAAVPASSNTYLETANSQQNTPTSTSTSSVPQSQSLLILRNRPKIHATAMEPSLPTVVEEQVSAAIVKLRIDSLFRASFSETKVEQELSDDAIGKMSGGGQHGIVGADGQEIAQAVARKAIRNLFTSSAATEFVGGSNGGAPPQFPVPVVVPIPSTSASIPSSSFTTTTTTTITSSSKSTIQVKETTKSTRFVRMDYNELCHLLNMFVIDMEKKWESNRKRKSYGNMRNGIKKMISLRRISSDPELLNTRGLHVVKVNIAMDANNVRILGTNLKRSMSDSKIR